MGVSGIAAGPLRGHALPASRVAAPADVGRHPRVPIPSLPLPAAQRCRYSADGLASLIALMGGADSPGGAGWFVNERV